MGIIWCLMTAFAVVTFVAAVRAVMRQPRSVVDETPPVWRPATGDGVRHHRLGPGVAGYYSPFSDDVLVVEFEEYGEVVCRVDSLRPFPRVD
jgi:hypothetical protein